MAGSPSARKTRRTTSISEFTGIFNKFAISSSAYLTPWSISLAEAEYPANIVIWPIQFTEANNDLTGLYNDIEQALEKIKAFLLQQGIEAEELSFSVPVITD